MRNLLFQTGFSLLLTHELDAVTQHEWRLLFILRSLSDSIGRDVFVAIHVPLFVLLLWLTQNNHPSLRKQSRLALSTFMVIHALLHWRLRHHPLNTFTTPLSLNLIYGAGLLGLWYVAISVISSVLQRPGIR